MAWDRDSVQVDGNAGLLAPQLRQSEARYQTVCAFDVFRVTTSGRHLSVCIRGGFSFHVEKPIEPQMHTDAHR